MDDVLIETQSGRIRSGLVDDAVASSRGRPWNGFFLKEVGSSDIEAQEIMLLKHAVCLQTNQPAELDWRGDGRFVRKTVLPGQVLVCPANRLYSIRYRHTGTLIVLLLEPEFLARALDNGALPNRPALRWEMGVDAPALRELLLLLRAESGPTAGGDAHYATAIARLIAIHLAQHYAEQRNDPCRRGGLSPTRLRKVVSLIEDRLDQDLRLEELAEVAGLSVFHFSRVFRQSTGMSPFQYVTKVRVERARELLLQPGRRIGEVALECGFCDQAHLTRHFKRVTGTTPAAFVRNVGHRSFTR